jgi:hypothetical protein
MKKRQYRVAKVFFTIGDIYNVPGDLICSGFGYEFKMYCCNSCGELFVADLEAIHFQKTTVTLITVGKKCPSCKSNLETSLVEYPENIFLNGAIQKNTNPIPYLTSDDEDNLREIYVLT